VGIARRATPVIAAEAECVDVSEPEDPVGGGLAAVGSERSATPAIAEAELVNVSEPEDPVGGGPVAEVAEGSVAQRGATAAAAAELAGVLSDSATVTECNLGNARRRSLHCLSCSTRSIC